MVTPARHAHPRSRRLRLGLRRRLDLGRRRRHQHRRQSRQPEQSGLPAGSELRVMLMRSVSLAPLLLSLLAGACGESAHAEPPVDGPDDDCTVPTLTDAPAPASALSAFGYDRAAAYDLAFSPIGTAPGVQIHALSFLSPRGTDRATGILFVPEGAGPFAGILLMHGLPGNAEQMTAYGTLLARHGAVVVALDAPFARRAGAVLRFTEAD